MDHSRSDAEPAAPAAPAAKETLARWLRGQGLLRGPFLFVDYWANVLGLRGVVPEPHARERLVDRALFRLGIDRPDLEVPRLRAFLLLFLVPVLLPLLARRPGRQRLRFLEGISDDVDRALAPYRLALEPAGAGRVHVRHDDRFLARDVLDPFAAPGFCSFFWAIYKLPVASLAAIVMVALLVPALYFLGVLGFVANSWALIAYPFLVLALYLLLRDWASAVLGALPVLIGRYLLDVFQLSTSGLLQFSWGFVLLVLLYLVVDWLFMPRPVPPSLLLYTADGPGCPYERAEDAPYWLDGRVYWVWRYLILTPAELNKFWERDWERVDLWIRADGPSAGQLEWVVTDMHYRELWIPFEKLADAETLRAHRARAATTLREGKPGFWLLEVDADLIFHYPFFRTVSFVPDEGVLPVRGILHVLRGAHERARERGTDAARRALAELRLSRGEDVLADLPELVVPRARTHMLAQPWTYWRYPLGAATRRELRLYEEGGEPARPPAADPTLQIKAPAAAEKLGS